MSIFDRDEAILAEHGVEFGDVPSDGAMRDIMTADGISPEIIDRLGSEE